MEIMLDYLLKLDLNAPNVAKKNMMETSKKDKNVHEVSTRANLAMAELDLGREAMATIRSVFGMPPPLATSNWKTHNENPSEVLTSNLEEQFKHAGKNLRKCLQNDNADIGEDDVIDVVVSYDRTWHHRGFKSSHGIGIVTSVDIGEILDAEVISKTCEICQHSKLDKTSSEFELWQQNHIQKHECLANFDGPSTSMETAAAKAIWSRSVATHNLRYTSILCDGDNKTLQTLNELKVYGDSLQISKLECVNHIHKRMGTGLRNLVKKLCHITGGRGGLTNKLIDQLSSYYRKHIMDHTTTCKNPDEISEAAKKMQINILAGLHHSIQNKDLMEQHKYGMDNSVKWCSYKKQLLNPQSK